MLQFFNSSFYRPVALFGADGSLQQQEEIWQKQTEGDQISEALNDRVRSVEIETQEKTKRLEDKVPNELIKESVDRMQMSRRSIFHTQIEKLE